MEQYATERIKKKEINTPDSTKKNNKLNRNTLRTLHANELDLYLLSKNHENFPDFFRQKT